MNLSSIFKRAEIEEAFKRLKSKRFKKSFDITQRFSISEERSINALGKYFERTSPRDYSKLLKDYSLEPYDGYKIKKSKAKFRPLLVPRPKDRVLLAAAFPKIRSRLAPVLRRHKALGLGLFRYSETTELKLTLSRILSNIQKGRGKFILKLDFKDFFSSIDRQELIKLLEPRFKSKNQKIILELISHCIHNQIKAESDFWIEFKHLDLKRVGVPQGLSYSPLLASFYATELDTVVMKVSGCVGYRYLDDMIILAPDKEKAEEVYELIKQKSLDLKLKLHPLEAGSKTQLIDIDKENFEFLGIEISKKGLFIPKKAVEDFEEVIQQEIVTRTTMKEFGLGKVMRVYVKYAKGWVAHYGSICPEHYEILAPQINSFLKNYIEKLSIRKKFFEPHRLTIIRPFIDLV